MKKRYLPLPIVLLMLLWTSVSAAKLPTTEERMDLGGVVKEITIPDGSPYALVHVRTVIDASPNAVWSVLKHIERWPSWLPMSQRAGFLSKTAASLITKENAENREKVLALDAQYPLPKTSDTGTETIRTAFEEYDLPWPIKNEWVVRTYTYTEAAKTKRAAWRRVISELPDEDDGFWDLSTWKDGRRTALHYYYRVKVKEGVPHAVFKTAISLTVNSMIKALRREAKRLDPLLTSAS